MYDKILVPLDQSHNADLALRHAIGLAKKFDSKLYLINVVDTERIAMYGTGMGYVDLTQDLRKQAKELLANRMEEVKSAGVAGEAILESGNPKATIAKTAPARYDIDLIVMGKSGTDALERIFIGSTTAYVVRHTDTNVLVIADDGEDE
ncbi:universal stress protein [Levilactobacillus bambusae]|uniref:Universal stress protein n=1 Tax=Levilactobacillus bambusae TaxID=2024736 RepID=A0A2V1N298_9LACO|nr:universal stress protein [Levilactobacillus bambusae]PWG00778.1 universal stress protein [Levilactobacillus bambusae]